MGFYHKNIGSVHQAVRIVLGLAVLIAAFVFLSGPDAGRSRPNAGRWQVKDT